MFELSLPLWGDVLLFVGAATVIGVAGVATASFADRLADRTGLGEALTGTVFLGFVTALPGLAASVAAALAGYPALAISNALGGIAVQTAALAVADIAYKRANLEHAAASAPNMMQACMLVALMVLVLVGLSAPNVTVLRIHPATIGLTATAGVAFWLVYRTRKDPMWRPTQTDETVQDEPEEEHKRQSLRWLASGLIVAAAITAVAGVGVAQAAQNLVAETAIPETIVGGLFMAVATSLPELVTSVAAVRRGALTLAVSDIVGGNFFDVLFVAAADAAYFSGSLFHGPGVGQKEVFLTSMAILLNVVLLTGLIYRQKHGPANIGFESVLMLVIYLGGFVVLSLGF
ncbi:MAG: sodium:calcium antiporter [Planctomycetota bacterium]|nr:MAG: sodium:calcium antiporter [Planctomycetota bacterium]